MAEMIAAGELPLWVRFSVRQGTRRKVALSQTVLSASTGLLSVIAGAGLLGTGRESLWGFLAPALGWFGLGAGLAAAGAGLWAWLAIRWVDRNRKWVQPAEPDAAADRPRE